MHCCMKTKFNNKLIYILNVFISIIFSCSDESEDDLMPKTKKRRFNNNIEGISKLHINFLCFTFMHNIYRK